VHPGLRHFADEFSATCVRVFAYIGALAVLVAISVRFFGSPAVEAAVEPARSAWTNVERPYRAFALTVPEFADPDPDYAIRRHPDGGRKDVLTWGDPSGIGSRLMLEIYRAGHEIRRFGEPATEVVARTAELGGPYALKPAEGIESKFGRLTAFDFTATQGAVRATASALPGRSTIRGCRSRAGTARPGARW
jgi:hypothetical protein